MLSFELGASFRSGGDTSLKYIVRESGNVIGVFDDLFEAEECAFERILINWEFFENPFDRLVIIQETEFDEFPLHGSSIKPNFNRMPKRTPVELRREYRMATETGRKLLADLHRIDEDVS